MDKLIKEDENFKWYENNRGVGYVVSKNAYLNTVDVNGREEHEAILKDPKKCDELGLDMHYEIMVYLKRWGSFLND